MKALLETAKEKFKTIREMGNDVREFVFVDCEEPEYQGIMKNELPSFWSEDLSKAWAGTDQNSTVKPVKPMLAIEIIEDPPQLSPDEAVSWQLQPLLPNYSQERILAIEAKWSKEELQDIAEKNNLRRSGGKDLLVRKLLYIGVLDNEGLLVAQNLKGEVTEWR
jgi:hypothetical protein